MTETARSTIEIAADSAAVMAVIADFEAYPQWVPQVKRVEIIETDSVAGRASVVRFDLDAGVVGD